MKNILRILLTLMLLSSALNSSARNNANDTIFIWGGTGNPPFEYLNDNGEPEGFNIELYHEMMKFLNRPYKLELHPWAETFSAVKEGDIDCVMGMVYTPARSEIIKFGRPTAYINLKWVVLDNSKYYVEEDLQGKKIACRNSGFAYEQMMQKKGEYIIDKMESNAKAMDELFDGNCDAVLCDGIIANYLIDHEAKYKGKFRILPSRFVNSEYRMTAKWENDVLLDSLEYALNELKMSGKYDEIYNKWFEPNHDSERLWTFLKICIVVICVIFAIAVLMIAIINHRVKKGLRTITDQKDQMQKQLDTINKQHDELLAARREAEANRDAKENFFANITHEFRTPLSHINGIVELMIQDALTKEEQDLMEIELRKSTHVLTGLLNSMVELAELERGSVVIKRDYFCINELVKYLVNDFSTVNSNPNVEVIYELPEESVWVYLDEKRTRNCMRHFMSNAMKFTHEGHVCMGVKLKEGGVQFYTRDTGVGMPPEQVRIIFERFYQKDKYTQGLGLGLYLAQRIISTCDGTLEVVSYPNKGTEFKVFVPCEVLIDSDGSLAHKFYKPEKENITDFKNEILSNSKG